MLRVPSIEKRLGKITSYLESQEGNSENDPSRLLAEAYQWFYSTGRYHHETPRPDDWAVYHLANHNSFDAILTGHTVLQFNEIQWVRQRRAFEEEKAQGRVVLGQPASRVSISPQFDDLYAQVPKHLQEQVAENLKALALDTRHQDRFVKHLRISRGLPCIEVASGVELVAELEGRIGICFLGFRFRAFQRPIAFRGHWQSKAMIAGLAIALGLLITSLLIVPYDVVMMGNGPRLQVFEGYTPVWSNPDIHRICGEYLEERLDPGSAFRNCYSSISLPRAALSSGAALVLVLSLLGLRRVMRRRKEDA